MSAFAGLTRQASIALNKGGLTEQAKRALRPCLPPTGGQAPPTGGQAPPIGGQAPPSIENHSFVSIVLSHDQGAHIYDIEGFSSEEIDEMEAFMDKERMCDKSKEYLSEDNQIIKELISSGDTPWSSCEFDGFCMDMDTWEDQCLTNEAFHGLLARSAQGGGQYLTQMWMPGYGHPIVEWRHLDYPSSIRPDQSTVNEGSPVLDRKDRLMVDVTITNKGPKYDNAHFPEGAVYIDKKFSKYVPAIGGGARMIVCLKPISNVSGKKYTHRFSCLRILQ
ncbi:hypothetical protein CMK20_19055 [Candidatus Poribacteria bacterium]|nr:hypothetical protein [Candidatus Poribacteria bacterium]|tara:strand:- start:2135 stop:2965 length:831 start_codon:yes stop_codon:yes gene_type:complete